MIQRLFNEPPTDKVSLYRHFFRTLYNNASKVILIQGLPEETDYHFIISQLLLVGRIMVFKKNGTVYLLNGNIGGKCDEYYYPTRVLIANPIIGSLDLERDKEAVPVFLTPTDRVMASPINKNFVPGGLYSLISMVANILAECMTTINVTLMNTRVHAIYTADSESAARSAEPVLKSIYEGKPFSVVTSELLERLNVNPLSQHGLSNCLIETLEVCQYVLSLFWNGIGIDANYNMKRERLITAEVDKNIQSLIVPIQTILETLNEGFEKANALFGTSLVAIQNPEFAISQEEGDDNDEENSSDGNSSEESVGGSDEDELADEDTESEGKSDEESSESEDSDESDKSEESESEHEKEDD